MLNCYKCIIVITLLNCAYLPLNIRSHKVLQARIVFRIFTMAPQSQRIARISRAWIWTRVRTRHCALCREFASMHVPSVMRPGT